MRARSLLHLVILTPQFLEMGVRSSLVEERVKRKVTVSEIPTPAAALLVTQY